MTRLLRLLLLIVLAVVLAYAGWRYFGGRQRSEAPRLRADAEGIVWEPLTEAGAARARAAIQALQQPRAPASTALRAGELAAYIYSELARQLPPSAENVQAAVVGDMLYVRASVRLEELGGRETLGALAGMLPERDTVRFGGTLGLVRPGLAQFRVRELRVGQFRLPQPFVPRLVRQVRRGPVPEGIADDALPLAVPEYLGDVRVADGRIIIYRSGA